MTTIQQIKDAIGRLPRRQFSEIRDWITEKDWRDWDDQIERDSETGQLDFLINEVRRDVKSGDTRPL